MLKPLVRITFAHLVWRYYKRTIVQSLLTIVAIIVIGLIHSDYLAYAQSQQHNDYVGLSFVVKWVVYLLALTWLVLGIRSDYRKRQKQAELKQVAKAPPVYASPEQDPFHQIRHKDKLKTRADLVIEKHRE